MVFTALFIPTKNHEQVLYRFDLSHITSTRTESLQTANRYTKIIQLNYQELGYVLKSLSPLEVSGALLSEGPDGLTYMDLIVTTYSNLLKKITKGLKLKVNVVYWRK